MAYGKNKLKKGGKKYKGGTTFYQWFTGLFSSEKKPETQPVAPTNNNVNADTSQTQQQQAQFGQQQEQAQFGQQQEQQQAQFGQQQEQQQAQLGQQQQEQPQTGVPGGPMQGGKYKTRKQKQKQKNKRKSTAKYNKKKSFRNIYSFLP